MQPAQTASMSDHMRWSSRQLMQCSHMHSKSSEDCACRTVAGALTRAAASAARPAAHAPAPWGSVAALVCPLAGRPAPAHARQLGLTPVTNPEQALQAVD